MAPFLYPSLYRLFLGKLDPERAHRLGLTGLRLAQNRLGLRLLHGFAASEDSRLRQELFGLTFLNPLGLAAGMDKDAEAVPAMFALGFGHVEVGTVTPRPQPGNERPRVWRFSRVGALINALGFPSVGAEAVAETLNALDRSRLLANGPLGINLGKNRDTSLDRAAADYAYLIDALYLVADYFTINVSSPNTPGLRALQTAEQLEPLLRAAMAAMARAAERHGGPVRPLLLKLSPDLTDDELPAIAETAASCGVSALIATNTTIGRNGVDPRGRDLPGGLSGSPLRSRARQVIRLLFDAVGRRVPIVGVGGVGSAEDAIGHIRAGASLVQLYTGFVYGGPAAPGRIVKGMSELADREQWSSISQLVGDERSSDRS